MNRNTVAPYLMQPKYIQNFYCCHSGENTYSVAAFLLQPKYIQNLMKKAQQREREQEIIYERKLANERNKEDHLYAGKDKFVTSAYKKKLAEQAKWMEEERLRQLQEEKDDVCIIYSLCVFCF